jgi:hypothetical protein
MATTARFMAQGGSAAAPRLRRGIPASTPPNHAQRGHELLLGTRRLTRTVHQAQSSAAGELSTRDLFLHPRTWWRIGTVHVEAQLDGVDVRRISGHLVFNPVKILQRPEKGETRSDFRPGLFP